MARSYVADTSCEHALKQLRYAGVVDVNITQLINHLSPKAKEKLHKEMLHNAQMCYQNCTDRKQVNFCSNVATMIEAEKH